MLEGIDISHHQASTPDLTRYAFVIVRAVYGDRPDDRYAQHMRVARQAGIPAGAYAFGRNAMYDPIASQVDAFLRVAADADFLALDREKDGANVLMTVSQAREFVTRVHAAGRRIGYYASDAVFRDVGQDFDWVANYSHEPARHWDFWQYRGSPLDLDRFGGYLSDLRKLIDLPDTGAAMDAFPAAAERSVADCDTGTKLYEDAACTIVGGTLGAPRTLRYLGNAAPGVVFLVHGPTAWCVRVEDAHNRRVEPEPPPDCSAAIAEDRKLAHVVVSWE